MDCPIKGCEKKNIIDLFQLADHIYYRHREVYSRALRRAQDLSVLSNIDKDNLKDVSV